jgi:hypothetical protein
VDFPSEKPSIFGVSPMETSVGFASGYLSPELPGRREEQLLIFNELTGSQMASSTNGDTVGKVVMLWLIIMV